MPVIIKGKSYTTIPERLTALHKEHAEVSITTKIIESSEEFVVMKACIILPNKQIFTGYAKEYKDSSYINETSYFENCETSAVGRALAFCGYGGDFLCSAEELTNAINNQGRVQTEALATDAQKKLLGKYDIVIEPSLTKEKASILISDTLRKPTSSDEAEVYLMKKEV